MKIFSNFDTQKVEKTLQIYQDQFGEERVILVQKSKLFWFIFIFVPMSFYIFVESIIIYLTITYLDDIVFQNIIIGLGVLIFIVFSRPILQNYIAYKLDFLVITPESIIKYDQEGFFERDVKTLNANNLKTISVHKQGFWKSVFNNGDMVFLSEAGKQGGSGEIKFRYVHKPASVRKKIEEIAKGK